MTPREIKQANDRIYSREYRMKHPAWKKKDNQKRYDLISKLVKEYYRRYPERVRAIGIFHYALYHDKIVKKPCIICGNPEVHGHHQDYSKPLAVTWLCARHHKAVHFGLI